MAKEKQKTAYLLIDMKGTLVSVCGDQKHNPDLLAGCANFKNDYNVKIVIASSYGPDSIKEKLTKLGVWQHVDYVVSVSDNKSLKKPIVEPLHTVSQYSKYQEEFYTKLQLMDVNGKKIKPLPQDMFLIDDEHSNILTAAEAHCHQCPQYGANNNGTLKAVESFLSVGSYAKKQLN